MCLSQGVEKGSSDSCFSVAISRIRPTSGQFPYSARLARLQNVLFNIMYPFICAELSDCQSGFRKKDSTSLQLIRLVQQWSEAVDKGSYVGVIVFDLKKAFDKVWHAGLLAKLENLGVCGNALSWIQSYLAGRSQCTTVAGVTSEFADLHAGVP